MLHIKGNSCAPGYGIGILAKSIISYSGTSVCKSLEQAREQSIIQMHQLYEDTLVLYGKELANIFKVYEAMLQDEALFMPIQEMIQQGMNPVEAVHTEIGKMADRFANKQIDSLSRRADDFIYLEEVLAEQLVGANKFTLPEIPEPVILYCRTLSPGTILKADINKLAGIIMERGGKASHAVILAKSRGIPVISGLPQNCDLPEASLIAINADTGDIWIQPDKEIIHAIQSKLDKADKSRNFKKKLTLPEKVQTADGLEIEIGINADSKSDLNAILSSGGAKIGLLRTENLFSACLTFPDEGKQADLYRLAITASDRRVVFRLFDFGSDKSLPYVQLPDEENPLMGMRGVQWLLEHPLLLREQLRALLIAGAGTELKLLIPMVCNAEDCSIIRKIIREQQDHLSRMGMDCCGHVLLGAMIETPAAAILADRIVSSVDFICLGTNDLAGYVTAADRGNPSMIHIYDQLHPAVLRLIHSVVDSCNKSATSLSICGEIAGDPDCAGLLIGLGLRQFSMPLMCVTEVIQRIRKINSSHMADMAYQALQQDSAGKIRQLISSK